MLILSALTTGLKYKFWSFHLRQDPSELIFLECTFAMCPTHFNSPVVGQEEEELSNFGIPIWSDVKEPSMGLRPLVL